MSTQPNQTPASGPSLGARRPPTSPLRLVARTAWILTLLCGVVGGYASGVMHLSNHSCPGRHQAYAHPPCHGGQAPDANP